MGGACPVQSGLRRALAALALRRRRQHAVHPASATGGRAAHGAHTAVPHCDGLPMDDGVAVEGLRQGSGKLDDRA